MNSVWYIYIYIYIYKLHIIVVIVIVVVWHIIDFLDISFPLTPGRQYGSPVSIAYSTCLQMFNIIKTLSFKFVVSS
jgi:hypothetical protein